MDSPAAPPPVSAEHLAALADAMALRSPTAEGDSTLRDSAALRTAGHSPDSTAWALTQRSFRAAASPKFGPHADACLYTRAGLEQASRRELAEHHARLLQKAGVTRVIDAGSGLGADSLAFLDAGLDVVALEIDPETAAMTAHNLARHPRGAHAQVLVADVLEVMESELVQPGGPWAEYALWFDPARRESGASGPGAGGRRRVFDPEEFSPPLSSIARVAGLNPERVVAAKLGPALEAASVPGAFDVEWITHRQDTSEAVILTPSPEPAIVARRISGNGAVQTMSQPRGAALDADSLDVAPEISAGDILWEPVGSILRAGFVQRLGLELDADLLAPDIAYLLSAAESPNKPETHPFAAPYTVREILPLHPKRMKAWVKANGITELTIKKRGIDVDPAILRRQLLAGAKKGPRQAATLVLTRHGSARVCVVVD
jgi:SAM-dependent methyltransferase